jgi:hypothetical protein
MFRKLPLGGSFRRAVVARVSGPNCRREGRHGAYWYGDSVVENEAAFHFVTKEMHQRHQWFLPMADDLPTP